MIKKQVKICTKNFLLVHKDILSPKKYSKFTQCMRMYLDIFFLCGKMSRPYQATFFIIKIIFFRKKGKIHTQLINLDGRNRSSLHS